MKKFISTLPLFLLIFNLTAAQNNNLGVKVSKNNLGLPLGNLLQPAIGFGSEIEWRYKLKKKESMFLMPFAGFYFKDQDSGLYLGVSFANDYSIKNKLRLGFNYGLAYLHSFNLNKVYDIADASNWESKNHNGKPTALFRLGIHGFYPISKKIDLCFYVTEGLQIPYTKLVGGAVRSSIQLGISYNLKNSSNNEK